MRRVKINDGVAAIREDNPAGKIAMFRIDIPNVKLVDHESKTEVSILVTVGNNAFDMKVNGKPASPIIRAESAS